VSAQLAAEASVAMKEIVDHNTKLFSERERSQQSHYVPTERRLAASKFSQGVLALCMIMESGLPALFLLHIR
jgi:hypothetical protein